MNAPPSFESFILFDGEKKIKIEKDSRIPDTCIFTILKEDATIGNLLRDQLLKDPNVLFAGFKISHPLDHKIILRVRTTPDYTPQEAVTNAINDLISEVCLIEEQFKEEIAEKLRRE